MKFNVFIFAWCLAGTFYTGLHSEWVSMAFNFLGAAINIPHAFFIQPAEWKK